LDQQILLNTALLTAGLVVALRPNAILDRIVGGELSVAGIICLYVFNSYPEWSERAWRVNFSPQANAFEDGHAEILQSKKFKYGSFFLGKFMLDRYGSSLLNAQILVLNKFGDFPFDRPGGRIFTYLFEVTSYPRSTKNA
jgi:hypothetical protein